jgi:hypothetical protein
MIYAPRRISTSVYLTEIQADVLLGARKVKYLDGLPSHPRPHARVAFYVKIGGFHAIHRRPRSSKERNIVRVSLDPQGHALLRLANS